MKVLAGIINLSSNDSHTSHASIKVLLIYTSQIASSDDSSKRTGQNM